MVVIDVQSSVLNKGEELPSREVSFGPVLQTDLFPIYKLPPELERLRGLMDLSAAVQQEVRDNIRSQRWEVEKIFEGAWSVRIPLKEVAFELDSPLFQALVLIYKDIFSQKWGQEYSSEKVAEYFMSHYQNLQKDQLDGYLSTVILYGVPIGAHVGISGACERISSYLVGTLKDNFPINAKSEVSRQMAQNELSNSLKAIDTRLQDLCIDNERLGYQGELFNLDFENIVNLVENNSKDLVADLKAIVRQAKGEDRESTFFKLIESFVSFIKKSKKAKGNPDYMNKQLARLLTLVVASKGVGGLEEQGVKTTIAWTAQNFEKSEGAGDSNAMAGIFNRMMYKNLSGNKKFIIDAISFLQTIPFLKMDKRKAGMIEEFVRSVEVFWEGEILSKDLTSELDSSAPNSTDLLVVGIPIQLAKILSDFILYKQIIGNGGYPTGDFIKEMIEFTVTEM